MSMIYITNHDENIYNITKTQQSDLQNKKKFNLQTTKSAQIINKVHHHHHHHRVTPAVADVETDIEEKIPAIINNKTHATMGLPEQDPPDPRNFLKKHTGKPSYSNKNARIKCERICRTLKLPHKAETPLIKDLLLCDGQIIKNQEENNKDFIKENVKCVKHLKAKEPEHRVVIDRVGTTVYPEEQGIEPVYIKRPIFGKTPHYLVRFNQIKEKEYQLRKDMSGKQQPKCRYITRDEREQLLNGLKKNWEELQKQYQGLPILTDTIPKKVKKSKLEAALKQLEKDVVLVERHPYIYVYNDSELNQ